MKIPPPLKGGCLNRTTAMKKLNYNRIALEEISTGLAKEDRDEMAIPSYLHSNPAITWLVTQRMHCALSTLNLKAKENLLDFGCGTGMLFLQLPPSPGKYYGVDLTVKPAAKFLKKHQRNDVRLLKAENWHNEIEDHSINKITAIEVLEHVDDVAELARLFHRKLAPGGRLIIAGPTENRFYRLCRKIAGFSGDYHHRNIYEIEQQVENAGFVEEKRTNLPLPDPLALFVVLSYAISKNTRPR